MGPRKGAFGATPAAAAKLPSQDSLTQGNKDLIAHAAFEDAYAQGARAKVGFLADRAFSNYISTNVASILVVLATSGTGLSSDN